MELLSPWATTTEPMFHNYWSLWALECVLRKQEKPLQLEAQVSQLERSPTLHSYRKTRTGNQEPVQSKIKNNKNDNI